MAGGEILFGVRGFPPLCERQAVYVVMPDVKHCGGLLEMTRFAALADAHEVAVAPHNPRGAAATAISVQICAGMKNFRILELQWGEVSWRSELVIPPERFEHGSIGVPDRPGFGIRLNDRLAKLRRLGQHFLPLELPFIHKPVFLADFLCGLAAGKQTIPPLVWQGTANVQEPAEFGFLGFS
jgi:L-alanine-DL-glutamate epimerase-like enolase superfamily enzyme